MKTYHITPNDADRRADRFLSRAEPQWKSHQLQKLFRKKDVKLDGRPIPPEYRLQAGQTLTVYAPAAWDSAENRSSGLLSERDPELVYEDSHLLVLWKPAGLLCQPAEPGDTDTLEGRLRGYLRRSGAWSPETENTFAPALCHRLDRGTEGLVLAAKTAEALRVLTEKIRQREITKRYRCLVHGRPDPSAGVFQDQLFKDAKAGRVYTRPLGTPGAKTAELRYTVLKTQNNLSLVDVELLTGRTHQIRVQFSSRGYPLLGDGKYGSLSLDKPYSPGGIALCAYRLELDFTTPAGVLEPLRGHVFERLKNSVDNSGYIRYI